MGFQAIVHAPVLRPGARLCVSDLDQAGAGEPSGMKTGDVVALRFGACCPDLASAQVETTGNGTILLRLAEARWHLDRDREGGGVTLPGLVSEDWYVVARA